MGFMAVSVVPSPDVLVPRALQSEADARGSRRTSPPTVERRSPSDVGRLASRVTEAREEERRRIARDLHDVVGQALTGARLLLLSMRDGVADAAVATRLQDTLVVLDHAMATVRTFATELRPEPLDSLGLEAAVRWQVHRAGRDAGIETTFETNGLSHELTPEVELACYRVFQEAVTNVLRHASAQRLAVRLEQRRESVLLVVTDDGVGFDVGIVTRRGDDVGRTLGLDGMVERARLVGGSVAFTSRPDGGCSVIARFPAHATAARRASV
jgi:signal transduction histidine kinase